MPPAADVQWSEPQRFVVGDSLIFQRNLPDFLPGAGWTITYTLTQLTPGGGIKKTQFSSTPSGDVHQINVPNFAAGLPSGDYLLTGEVINTDAPPIKHQIYYGSLTLQADLADGLADAALLTEAQKRIAQLKPLLDQRYQHYLSETDVQRAKFAFLDYQKVRLELNFWEERRAHELNVQGIINGRPNQNVIAPAFNVG